MIAICSAELGTTSARDLSEQEIAYSVHHRITSSVIASNESP